MNDPGIIFDETARRIAAGESFALVTVIKTSGSTPRKEGSRMLVDPEGQVQGSVGGGALEHIAVRKSLESLTTGEIVHLDLDLDDVEKAGTGMVCGGRVELMIEPFGTGPRLLLFGAGHVAQSTARLASELGFRVTVHDSRGDWATKERFPGMEVRVLTPGEISEKVITTGKDYLAVMTHSHSEDYKILINLIRKEYFYLGVIGSKKKSAEIRKQLSQDGFSPEEIERMTCPIGFDIGSHTPLEIAVSVAAQLVHKGNLE